MPTILNASGSNHVEYLEGNGFVALAVLQGCALVHRHCRRADSGMAYAPGSPTRPLDPCPHTLWFDHCLSCSSGASFSRVEASAIQEPDSPSGLEEKGTIEMNLFTEEPWLLLATIGVVAAVFRHGWPLTSWEKVRRIALRYAAIFYPLFYTTWTINEAKRGVGWAAFWFSN